ncbi:MAG: 3'-5' exonuclease [Candidatus Paceibacterota bacterium]
MTDIETLGTDSNSTIFQISAIAFNINTGEHFSEFDIIADIGEDDYLDVSGATLKWWLNTDKELLTRLLNSGEGSTDDLLREFHDWLEGLAANNDVYLWGNGILFDNKMIQHQFEMLRLNYPIYYRNDRDLRTLVDLASAKLGITTEELKERFNDEELVKHDAFDDVKYQINLAINCYGMLTR